MLNIPTWQQPQDSSITVEMRVSFPPATTCSVSLNQGDALQAEKIVVLRGTKNRTSVSMYTIPRLYFVTI